MVVKYSGNVKKIESLNTQLALNLKVDIDGSKVTATLSLVSNSDEKKTFESQEDYTTFILIHGRCGYKFQ